MKIRAFWIISLAAILLAIVLHLNALGAAAKQIEKFKLCMTAIEPQKQELKAEAKRFGHQADIFVTSGWAASLAMRTCIRCDDKFLSVGPQNRLCRRCNRRPDATTS